MQCFQQKFNQPTYMATLLSNKKINYYISINYTIIINIS